MTEKTLNDEQVHVLRSFMTAVDGVVGIWPQIETTMRDDWGIENPEDALADLENALE